MPVACVTIYDPEGRPFIHVTAGETLFAAVSNAIDWFDDPFWNGPKPRPGTVFKVTLVGDSRAWHVTYDRVEEWRAQHTTHRPTPGNSRS